MTDVVTSYHDPNAIPWPGEDNSLQMYEYVAGMVLSQGSREQVLEGQHGQGEVVVAAVP